MGAPLHVQALASPATSAVCCVLLCTHAWVLHRGLGYGDVGYTHRALREGRVHRAAVAACAHVHPLHLAFNLAGLWALRPVEGALGSGEYLSASLLLLAGGAALTHAAYHALIVWLRRDGYDRHEVVGYSGVVFGLMALQAARAPRGAVLVVLGARVPAALAPFASLLLTSLLVPNASFIGHAAGILAGFALGLGGLRVLSAHASLLILASCAAACAHSAGLTSWLRLWATAAGAARPGDGLGPTRIIGGRVVRTPLEEC